MLLNCVYTYKLTPKVFYIKCCRYAYMYRAGAASSRVVRHIKSGSTLTFVKGVKLMLCRWVHLQCAKHTEMQSMRLLGGLGAYPLRKFLKNACSEIESFAF